MVRLFYFLGMCAMLAASGIFALWLSERNRPDAQLEEIRSRPGAVQVFRAQNVGSAARSPEVSALIVQAKAFALYLNPAKSPDKPSAPGMTASTAPPVPVVRPPAASMWFKLCGTSYYPDEPGRSMALISEPGSGEGGERWVKEGTQLGHFVIHEIRKGMIVYRDGDNLREIAVEHGAGVPGIVRDARPGSRQVSSAADGIAATLSAPAGPNNVGPVGGN